MVKNNDDFHHILEAKISPPIFVDSRKTARENHKNLKVLLNKYIEKLLFLLQNREIYSFLEPFHPDTLNKIFIKRENKKNFGFEEEIENSLRGLTHYFSAPNIRNKVIYIINVYNSDKLGETSIVFINQVFQYCAFVL